MADLSTRQRDDLKNQDFAYVDKNGERHLPIHDQEHVRNAAARFSQTRFESAEAKHKAARHIVSAAKKHGVEIGDDAVSKAADNAG